MAALLTQQLKKDNFSKKSKAASTFEELKKALLDFTVPVFVETDASGEGLGAVLS